MVSSVFEVFLWGFLKTNVELIFSKEGSTLSPGRCFPGQNRFSLSVAGYKLAGLFAADPGYETIQRIGIFYKFWWDFVNQFLGEFL